MSEDFPDGFRDLVESATDGEVVEAIYVIAHEDEDGTLHLTTGGVKPITPEARRELLKKAMERIK